MKKLTALAGALLILILLQAVLMPKYLGRQREGGLIREYYVQAGGHDVIFVGDCEVYENISPITLWREQGIPAYIRGSPQQTVWQSYYLMEETLRYETPKVMVYNVLALKYDTPQSTGNQRYREAYNRMCLDGMRWSDSKWKSIQASLTREEKQWGGALTYVFPILRFHDRWQDLSADDFRYAFRREAVTDCGYLMQTEVRPITDDYVSAPVASYRLGDNSWYYLDKMARLCQEKGVELVLIKSSALYPVWWWEWDEQVAAWAEERGIRYLNLIPHEAEIGIDWNTDTYDGGFHLNVTGAEKEASYLGAWLRENCGLPDRREDEAYAALWAEKTAAYDARKEALTAAFS